jgi:hypothetical protein
MGTEKVGVIVVVGDPTVASVSVRGGEAVLVAGLGEGMGVNASEVREGV